MTARAGTTPLTSEQQMNVFRLRDKMSLLNAEFLQVLNGFYKEKNHYDFTNTMTSYMTHVRSLKTMYKVDDDVAVAMQNDIKSVGVVTADPAPKAAIPEPVVASGSALLRKKAKAVRRNGTDSPKVSTPTVFAASSPATVTSVPKFGDISVISKETPAPLSKAAEPAVPSAPATARKRAIRGGGPLGDSESVVFKSGGEEQATTSTVKIPEVTIKFPEPSKDFWTKKDDGAASNGGSLFAFLKKDGEQAKETSKFTGFSFGKKADSETEKKPEDAPAPTKSLFGSPKEASPKPPATGSIFNSSPTKPLVFGEPTDKSDDAPKPFAPLSFGASLFGSSASSSTAPTLSFGSSSGTASTGSSLFSGFAGLAQKAMDNQAKPADDEEGEYVPPKVEAVEAEEPDAVLSSKVSVFKFSGKEYTKLGVGMLHVKDTDGKFSVLIRAATTTGTVWLNSLCNKAMKATKVDGNRVRLTCPTSQTEMTTMVIRFGTPEGATQFFDKIEEVAK